jgi:hypothetical protein
MARVGLQRHVKNYGIKDAVLYDFNPGSFTVTISQLRNLRS